MNHDGSKESVSVDQQCMLYEQSGHNTYINANNTRLLPRGGVDPAYRAAAGTAAVRGLRLGARHWVELDPLLLLVVEQVALAHHRLHERHPEAGLVHVLAPVLLNRSVRLPQVVAAQHSSSAHLSQPACSQHRQARSCSPATGPRVEPGLPPSLACHELRGSFVGTWVGKEFCLRGAKGAAQRRGAYWGILVDRWCGTCTLMSWHSSSTLHTGSERSVSTT